MNTGTVVGIIDVYIVIPSFLYIGSICHEADTHNGDVKHDKSQQQLHIQQFNILQFGQQHFFLLPSQIHA